MSDTTVACDYLIVTPGPFASSAQRLAQHRNDYVNDDVHHARYVTLSTIYAQFNTPDTLPTYLALWEALRFARLNWHTPFGYLVLLGDDSLSYAFADSSANNHGLTPTFGAGFSTLTGTDGTTDTSLLYTDNFYATLLCSLPPSRITPSTLDWFPIGRIPCESAAQCSSYVSKVIAHETGNPMGFWRNHALFAADDAFQGASPDPVNHLRSAERVSSDCFRGFYKTRHYLCSFPRDPYGRHADAGLDFFRQVNNGVSIVVFFGHGHSDSLTNEGFLRTSDHALFDNLSTPPHFFSFSCDNGQFLRKDTPQMCKSFLLRPQGGCLSYFASTNLEYGSPNENFASLLFSLAQDTVALSIGKAIVRAQQQYPRSYYHLLGDPALNLHPPSYSPQIRITKNGDSSLEILCDLPTPIASPLHFSYVLSTPDTIACMDDTSRSYIRDSTLLSSYGTTDATFHIAVPSDLIHLPLRFTTYAWNESIEIRGDTLISPRPSAIAHLKKVAAQQFTLDLHRGVLRLHDVHGLNRVSVSLFDLLGRARFHHVFTPTADAQVVALPASHVARANYVLQISFDNNPPIRRLLTLH